MFMTVKRHGALEKFLKLFCMIFRQRFVMPFCPVQQFCFGQVFGFRIQRPDVHTLQSIYVIWLVFNWIRFPSFLIIAHDVSFFKTKAVQFFLFLTTIIANFPEIAKTQQKKNICIKHLTDVYVTLLRWVHISTALYYQLRQNMSPTHTRSLATYLLGSLGDKNLKSNWPLGSKFNSW